jgi:hypothetical protein
MPKKSTRHGLERRHRDTNGEIRRIGGETRVGTLRKTYGSDFAPGVRSDAKLKTLVKGYGSLKGEFVVRRGIDITKPIFEQANKSAKKGARR